MRHLLQKVQNNRGETLIEVLASVLITALSVALLFTCVMATTKMDSAAKEKDSGHYEALSNAEVGVSAQDKRVTVTRVKNPNTDPGAPSEPTPSAEATATPFIQINGGEEMYSYKGS